ncbi:hypothetical protein [Micromonospora sp. ATCC 39149]|uniref:Uncharacterized protein n=1 Tax=Micromonospora carbonacea TaxID=47853 RepID=A0A7D6CFR3_9ACTN|nr:hypothetical protein [Micromonospora sp. ATCC 39149]QLJ98571.1 hypothetical protein HZU44_28705 [Micromonospora carbonacea]
MPRTSRAAGGQKPGSAIVALLRRGAVAVAALAAFLVIMSPLLVIP